MHKDDWKSFEKTGCVTDYLRYKGIVENVEQVVGKAVEMRECTNAESSNGNGDYHKIRTY